MESEFTHLALIGQPGIGKSTSFKWLSESYPGQIRIVPKITTRPARPNEPEDTIPDYPVLDFLRGMRETHIDGYNQILLPHQPFGDHWYGYRREDLLYQNGRLNVLEPNPELQLPDFKRIFGAKALVVALMSRDLNYIRSNLIERGTETPEKLTARLKTAEELIPVIDSQLAQGNIDLLLELGWHNRDQLRPTILGIAGKLLNIVYNY
jgi:guanylate kinase